MSAIDAPSAVDEHPWRRLDERRFHASSLANGMPEGGPRPRASGDAAKRDRPSRLHPGCRFRRYRGDGATTPACLSVASGLPARRPQSRQGHKQCLNPAAGGEDGPGTNSAPSAARHQRTPGAIDRVATSRSRYGPTTAYRNCRTAPSKIPANSSDMAPARRLVAPGSVGRALSSVAIVWRAAQRSPPIFRCSSP